MANYAALVGTVSLAWQVLRARRSDRPGITVLLSNEMLGARAALVPKVCVKAVNGGERPIGVTAAGLELQDGRLYDEMFSRKPADTLPGTVQPRHEGNCYFDVDQLEVNGFDLTRPLVGFVNLATGEPGPVEADHAPQRCRVRSSRTTSGEQGRKRPSRYLKLRRRRDRYWERGCGLRERQLTGSSRAGVVLLGGLAKLAFEGGAQLGEGGEVLGAAGGGLAADDVLERRDRDVEPSAE